MRQNGVAQEGGILSSAEGSPQCTLKYYREPGFCYRCNALSRSKEVRGAHESIKPGVERSGTPGNSRSMDLEPAERAIGDLDKIVNSQLTIGPAISYRPLARALDFLFVPHLGFRFAPPQALCCRALRALSLNY